MIIDCHGHYTTAPKALEAWRNQKIAGIKDPAVMPKVADLKISDDELRETIEANQQERGADLTIFSPRASFMAHHIGYFAISSTWASISNELCYRVSKLFPDNFIGAAMLSQSPGVDPKTCIPELEKCVKEYGFVGINLNPDPSGGWWTSPLLQGPISPSLGIAMDMSIQLKAENGAICTLSLSFNNDGPLGTFFRYIGDTATYIARYDDLYTGKDEKIDVSKVDVSMNGIELQDREFFAAIREGREPNASVEQVLPCYRVLGELGQQLQ